MQNGASQSVTNGTKLDNDITLTLKKVPCDFPFPPREGCVACACEGKVYVFGGVIQSDGVEPQETNDLLCFDVASATWQKVKTSGTPPPARAAASLVAVGNKLYLFGGLSHMFGWFDDMFMFDTETSKWAVVDATGPTPRARDKLQAVAIGTSIHYFGGFGPKTDEDVDDLDESEEEEIDEIPEAQMQQGAEFGWFNDLYVFDTVSCQWSQPMQMNLGVPSPRAAHGMCAVGDNIYIFGGRDIEDRQNDLHCFNTVTRKWDTDLSAKGVPPAPRSFHTLTAVGKRLVVIGGRGRKNDHFADVHVFDTETKEWLQPQLQGFAASARGQHIAVVVGDKLVVFGGTGNFSAETMQCQEFYKDTFLISAEEVCRGGATVAANGSG